MDQMLIKEVLLRIGFEKNLKQESAVLLTLFNKKNIFHVSDLIDSESWVDIPMPYEIFEELKSLCGRCSFENRLLDMLDSSESLGNSEQKQENSQDNYVHQPCWNLKRELQDTKVLPFFEENVFVLRNFLNSEEQIAILKDCCILRNPFDFNPNKDFTNTEWFYWDHQSNLEMKNSEEETEQLKKLSSNKNITSIRKQISDKLFDISKLMYEKIFEAVHMNKKTSDFPLKFIPNAARALLYPENGILNCHKDDSEFGWALNLSLGFDCNFKFSERHFDEGDFKEIVMHSGDCIFFNGDELFHGERNLCKFTMLIDKSWLKYLPILGVEVMQKSATVWNNLQEKKVLPLSFKRMSLQWRNIEK